MKLCYEINQFERIQLKMKNNEVLQSLLFCGFIGHIKLFFQLVTTSETNCWVTRCTGLLKQFIQAYLYDTPFIQKYVCCKIFCDNLEKILQPR